VARVLDNVARRLYAAVGGRRAPLDDPTYEPDLQRALEAVVEPGWVCADVGAHHGIISAALARLVGPGGRVVAFEAHPDNAAQVRSAFAHDERGARVRVENRAVTDGSTDTVWLHAGRARHSTEWNVVGADVDGNPTAAELQVPSTSLDAYFESRLDFAKIDVEGAEADVLAGMRRILREQRPVLAIEFHNETGWEGRRELFDASYDLYELDGRRLDPERDTTRVYQCLAAPRERSLHLP
jgi:FkbM family methyltransferase